MNSRQGEIKRILEERGREGSFYVINISVCFHGSVFRKGSRDTLRWRLGKLRRPITFGILKWEVFYQCPLCTKTNMMYSDEVVSSQSKSKPRKVGRVRCTICSHCGRSFTAFLVGYYEKFNRAEKRRKARGRKW